MLSFVADLSPFYHRRCFARIMKVPEHRGTVCANKSSFGSEFSSNKACKGKSLTELKPQQLRQRVFKQKARKGKSLTELKQLRQRCDQREPREAERFPL